MAIDWPRIRASKWASEGGPPEWPTGVRPISMDGLTLLGIGPDNRLYFDGQLLELSRTIRLSWYQGLLAVMTAAGTFLGGAAAVVALLR